jgi:hypothetical protein
VATLWGPIPAEELIRRATRVLQTVRGVYEVRSELFVAAPQPAPMALPKPDPPAHTESASPNRLDELTGRKSEAPRAQVTLLGPVAADMLPTPPVEDVRQAVERLRQSDLRFQAIQVEVRADVVVVRGGRSRAEYVTAFAQAVAKLPGVARVVVEPQR